MCSLLINHIFVHIFFKAKKNKKQSTPFMVFAVVQNCKQLKHYIRYISYCFYCSVFSVASLLASGADTSDFGAAAGFGLLLDCPDFLPPRWLLASSACRL